MKKSELRKIIKEEIKSTLKEDDFGVGVEFNPGSERNPSNKMIYDLLKEVRSLLKKGQGMFKDLP